MQASESKDCHNYLNKLVIGMGKYQYDKKLISKVLSLIDTLSQYNSKNLDKYINKLILYLPQKEQFVDIIIEGEMAIWFSQKKFEITFYPSGEKGVDLQIFWQPYQVFVEVSHFREDDVTNEKLKKGEFINGQEVLVRYGGRNDLETLYSKIIRELEHLPNDEIGIIALKSDNVRIEDIEFESVIDCLNIEAKENDTLKNLSGVLFDRSWFSRGTRFYFWRNTRASMPIDEILCNQLLYGNT